MNSSSRLRMGFTVIELLVVISIIGMLISLLLPAIQAAREAARLTTCKNNLRQCGVAILSHESARRRFPSGGWGYIWYGDCDRGTGRDQPGGWIYSVLPYLERRDIAALGRGKSDLEKLATTAMVNQLPLVVMNCPSRRRAALYPFDPTFPPRNADFAPFVAKSDYAGNAGDLPVDVRPGPGSLGAGDDPAYPWQDFSKSSGVFHGRSEIRFASVVDSASHTYLVGEKYVSGAEPDLGDDQGMYVGYGYDTLRWTALDMPPRRDSSGQFVQCFGSSHVAVCQFVFCDGSVRAISYDIDPEVHRRLGNRQDQLPFSDSTWMVD